MKTAFAGIPILFVLVMITHANNAYAPCPGEPGFNCNNYPESNLSTNPQIVNLKVSPSIPKVGDTLTVTVTLVNNSTIPIVVDGGKCSAQDTQAELFTIILDNHVKNKAENINCAGVGWSPLLDLGKNITGTSPDYTTNYVATEPGTATITVTFSYHTIIQTDPIQTSDEQTISKSFQFLIHDINETYAQKPPAYFASPLQQIKAGISVQNVKCGINFNLVIKSEDGSPACVKPETISKLVERGWTKLVFQTGIVMNSYTPISNDTENKTVKVVAIKMVPPYTPGGPLIQLTLQNVSMMPITHLTATLETNQNYTFNFKSVTSLTPIIPGNSISDTTMLIGGGFQTEATYALIMSGMQDHVPFGYTEKVHIQG